MSPIPTFTGLGPEPQYEDIVNKVNLLVGELRNLMLGMDSVNMFEVGGWLVTSDQLASSDGDVGMSTIDTVGDDIRFWAGDAIDGIPKFKVTKSGILNAVDGNFEGSITSSIITGGTITGALIQTAATGRRIALVGDQLQSLDTSTLDGFTLEGSTGSLGWYNSGVKTGSITRDTSQPYEQFLFSHDYLLLSGTLGIDLPSASITIGNVGGNIYMVGNTSFSGTTVTGLITNTISDHNHGITSGRYLMTYDSGGLELGLQLFSASGGHSHTVLAS